MRPLPGMSIIGENIRLLRKKLGLTQEAMAGRLGIKRSLLGAYEEGRATPRLDVLTVYSELSGIRIAELINQADTLETPGAEPEKPRRGRPRKGDVRSEARAEAPGPYRLEAALPYPALPRNGKALPEPEPAKADADGNAAYFSGQEIRIVTVTRPEKAAEAMDSFESIPNSALGEYTARLGNAAFLSRQPRMSLPFLKAGELYRAFGEGGKAAPGRYLVGSYIRNWLTLNSKETYLIVTGHDILHARLENRLSQSESLLITSGRSLVSGRTVSQVAMPGTQVLEAWRLEYVLAPGLRDEPELSTRLSRIESYLGL